jgi:hypothetical protein
LQHKSFGADRGLGSGRAGCGWSNYWRGWICSTL